MDAPDRDAIHRRLDDWQREMERLRLRPHDLRRGNLRYCLMTVLAEAGRPCTIAELIRTLEQRGLHVGGADPRKVVSDALRYEARLGRVRRVRRGTYESGYRPDTTVRRHRDRMRDLIAVSRGEPVGPT